VSDERGEPIKVFGATQDVTELKRGEEKLKATSQQLRALSARLQSAREEEGIRIAREIHDELGSSLTRLKWDLEIMSKEELGTQDQERLEKSRRKISEMIALVDETVNTVRRISAELRPSALDDLGLGAALRLQARQFQDRTGIIADCDCAAESVKLTQQQSTAVFRICEEALTNVMRHSYATRVEVRLKIDQGDLVLTVRDNGLGIMPVEMSDSLSLGLLGMRDRARLIGGDIEIEGIEDKGTVVTARVPISRGS
jgi:signal transduction histidine kinase